MFYLAVITDEERSEISTSTCKWRRDEFLGLDAGDSLLLETFCFWVVSQSVYNPGKISPLSYSVKLISYSFLL